MHQLHTYQGNLGSEPSSPDIVVPSSRHQEILLDGCRRKCKAWDGVIARICNLVVLVRVAQAARCGSRAEASGGGGVGAKHGVPKQWHVVTVLPLALQTSQLHLTLALMYQISIFISLIKRGQKKWWFPESVSVGPGCRSRQGEHCWCRGAWTRTGRRAPSAFSFLWQCLREGSEQLNRIGFKCVSKTFFPSGKHSPSRSVLKIHFFIESGPKMIQFKIHSKQNPEYSLKKYSFNRVQTIQ